MTKALPMLNPIDPFRLMKTGDHDFWSACRSAIESWFQLSLQEEPGRAGALIDKTEAFLGYPPSASVARLIRLMVALEQGDPHHEALDLKPCYSELTTAVGDFVTFFTTSEEDDIRYGLKRLDGSSLEADDEHRRQIYCIDFDREEDDLDEDDPDDSLSEPEVELFSFSPEDFVLRLLTAQYSELTPHVLYLNGEVDDDDTERVSALEDALRGEFGDAVVIQSYELWGGPGVLIAKYAMAGTCLDVIAHSRESASRIDDAVFKAMGLSSAEIDRHDFG